MTVERKHSTRDEPGIGSVILRGDMLVLAVAGLLLLGGWAVRAQHVERTATYRGHGVQLEHPRGWSVAEGRKGAELGPGQALVSGLLASGREAFLPRITVVDEHLPREVREALALEDFLQLELRRSLVLFHGAARRQLTIGGKGAVRIDYAHAVNPSASNDHPGVTDVPVVIRAATVGIIDGTRLRRVTVELSQALARQQPGLIDRVLSSLKPEVGQ